MSASTQYHKSVRPAVDLSVARMIQAQLGGACLALLGARDLLGSANALQFHIGRSPKHVRTIEIRLDPSDTYTVTFYKGAPNALAKYSEVVEDVYVDMLHEVIETHTGLYVHF